jgi:hypothetical protein
MLSGRVTEAKSAGVSLRDKTPEPLRPLENPEEIQQRSRPLPVDRVWESRIQRQWDGKVPETRVISSRGRTIAHGCVRSGSTMRTNISRGFVLALCLSTAAVALLAQANTASSSAAGSPARVLGTIRAIAGLELTVATDQGTQIQVTLSPETRLLRLAPGQTDWKRATPVLPSDLAVGDRVLARGSADTPASGLRATTVLVMKRQDIAQRNRQELAEWQRHGVGGLVRQVDARARTITIAVSGMAGSRSILVRTSPQTTFRRYAPDSVRWADTVPSGFAQIRPGDQLRAKGSRSEDSSEIQAEEIVTGSFRNLSGKIVSVDAVRQMLTLKDLATRSDVTVAITPDSQMRKLPPHLAQALAERLHPTGRAANKGEADGGDSAGEKTTKSSAANGESKRGEELNQMLAKLPALSLETLHKGDAVMIVSTPGSEHKLPAVVTLLGGVEPLLTSAPAGGGNESLLTPWSLASAPGGE